MLMMMKWNDNSQSLIVKKKKAKLIKQSILQRESIAKSKEKSSARYDIHNQKLI